ncbi:MAG: glycosyltransferase family 4 protein [Saprospiraceae bacterium]|nr:glycosyltransferase family 4 protein [Saprospiraceae bacterium]
MKYKRLVVFSGKIGYDVSGGSDATMYITAHLEDWLKIEFVCFELFDMRGRANEVTMVVSLDELRSLLEAKNDGQTLFYGDFRDAVVLSELRLPYIFSYHDNWPGAGIVPGTATDAKEEAIATYAEIFRNALYVFAVSEHSLQFIEKYTANVKVVRNGFTKRDYTFRKTAGLNMLMIGNVDQRKYGLLPALMAELKNNRTEVQIDVYGNLTDDFLATSLKTFEQIDLIGFRRSIDLSGYSALLCVSYMENLPISIVEAVDAGLPVIAFDVGGISEIIDEEAGFLISPYDVKTMAHAIASLVDFGLSGIPRDLSGVYNWKLAAEGIFLTIKHL